MKKCKAFVFPSYYEGFGIPILEAFEAECPVALSRSSCFPEIAGEAAVYFNGEESQSIYNTISNLIEDESLRNELKKRGIKRCKDFSWEKSAAKLTEIYRSVLENAKVD